MSLPDRMHAIGIREPGAPEVLTLIERPLPLFRDDEVLIRVAAAGVNRPDCLQRRGLYPPPPGASDLPGLEVAGVVVRCGSGVRSLHEGDRVCALLAGGGYAQFVSAPAAQCLPVPSGLGLTDSAVLPEAAFTVWTNVFERGRLSRGEVLVVHGGASGIGTLAIQLGRARGARVFATVGNEAKATLAGQLGAERAIDYRQERFGEVVRAATAGHGADVILDIVGGAYLADNLALLAEDGRLVVIAVLGGAKAELNLATVLTRRLTVTGSTLRARSVAEKGRIAAALRAEVWPLIESGAVRPVLQASFPLREAARAHEWLEANRAMGKLALIVDDTL